MRHASLRRSFLPALCAVLLVSAAATPADAQESEPIEIREWQVPWPDTRPRDPALAPNGDVWFVGQRAHYAARLDPTTGDFERFELLGEAGPHNLIVADDGTVWYAGNGDAHIGHLDPATGEIVRHDMPDLDARDPHTLIFDGRGGIWFTVQGGNMVGHLDMTTGAVRLTPGPEAEGRGGRPASSRPYGIKLDSRGHPWVALFGTNMIATVDPASMEMSTFEIPAPEARPRRLVVDSRDRVWWVDYARGKLGRFDPRTGEFDEWDSPAGDGARGYGMAIDAADRIWYVETGHQPNTFVGFDTATEEFISVTEVGSGGGTIRHMYYDPAENVIWFGTDNDTVGKAVLPPLGTRVISP